MCLLGDHHVWQPPSISPLVYHINPEQGLNLKCIDPKKYHQTFFSFFSGLNPARSGTQPAKSTDTPNF
jgi:hypothetical protein